MPSVPDTATPSSSASSDAAASGDLIGFREPPCNLELEQAFLGSVFQSSRVYEDVSDFLLPEHFASALHGRIYQACSMLIERDRPATPVTLKTYLENDPLLSEAGGTRYFAELADAMITVVNARDYGRQIYELALRRALIEVGRDLVNDAFEASIDRSATTQIENAEQRLYQLASTGRANDGLRDFNQALTSAVHMAEAAYRHHGRLVGVTTGLVDLDKKLGGLHRSDLVIMAGRPSMGKTALATGVAFNAARAYRERITDDGKREVEDGAVVAFFSLEMSAEQLAARLLSQETQINSHKIRTGELNDDAFARIAQAAQEIHRIPLYIDDTAALSVSAIRTRCRRLARSRGLGLVVIDYLQLLVASPGERHDNRVNEVSSITRALKALAKELNTPVIAVSQLSRAVEQREDKTPQLSDLRESGSIEQDADVVLFLYREQYYHQRDEPKRRSGESDAEFVGRYTQWKELCERVFNQARVEVAKQRHGPIGPVRLHFDGDFTKFSNWIDDSHTPFQN